MIKKITIQIIKLYQIFISPILGRNCRFYPSCSNYTVFSMGKYGILKGLQKGIWRVLKCNQFFKGGVDLPR